MKNYSFVVQQKRSFRLKRYHIAGMLFISGLMLGCAIPSVKAAEATVFRGVCVSATLAPKYYQQGVEVLARQVFYVGIPLEAWLNAQDTRTGGSGGYSCHVEKALPYSPKFLSAIKDVK